jgi:hypothetical protein
MPARDDHLEQARHNVQFYASIDRTVFKDWAVTVLFYTGLHYIDAFLAEKRSIHPPKHKQRDTLVSTVTELRPILADYFALKNGSFNARYMPPTRFTDQYVSNLENQHLARIKSQIGRFVTI